MRNIAVDNYPHALEFVSESYKSQNICDKAVSTYPSAIKFLNAIQLKKCVIKQLIVVLFDSIPDWYKPQEMRDSV